MRSREARRQASGLLPAVLSLPHPRHPGGNQASETAHLSTPGDPRAPVRGCPPPPRAVAAGTHPPPTSNMGEAPLLGNVQPRSSTRNFAIYKQ